MSTTTTPNMNLNVPVVGGEAGPQYATDINNCMTVIDQHDHTSGSGVLITPAAININANLAWNGNNINSMRAVRFSPQLSAITATSPDIECVYVAGVDLYYNDGSGNQVRITQSGAVTGSPGSISNLTSPASASYVGANSTFVWQSASNTAANMDGGSVILRNITASSKGLTINPPNAMAADYSLNLPSLPASARVLVLDTSGNITPSAVSNTGTTQSDVLPGFGLLPSGAIIPYGGTSAPVGYLLCDGTSYVRATYPNLFTAISTAYGTADGTHFNVPDLRGMFIRGVSGSTSNDPDKASRTANNTGGATGNNVGSQQVSGFAAHTHDIIQIKTGTDVVGGTHFTLTSDSYNAQTGTTSTGGNETRPINVYVQYIIKT